MKKPPRRPYCKERLVKVRENNYSTKFLTLYQERKFGDGIIEMYCRNCAARLYDVFPDGVCTYVRREENKI